MTSILALAVCTTLPAASASETDRAMMSVSYLGLAELVLVALFALGVLVAIVVLLANPKTRAAGIVLLLLPGLLALGSIAAFLFLVPRHVGRPVTSQEARTAAEMKEYEMPYPPAGIFKQPVASGVHAEKAEQGDATTKSETAKPPAAAERPEWVGAEPRRVGDAYQMSIDVGPYTTRLECDAKLPEALQEALDEYVELCLGTEAAGKVRLQPDELREALVREQWEETRQYTIGAMQHLHVLLAFDMKFKDRVQQQWRREVVAGRLWVTGAAVAAVLSMLLVSFGYLKITGRSVPEAKR